MTSAVFVRFTRSLALLAAAFALAVMPARAQVTSESELKAAYLVNFLK